MWDTITLTGLRGTGHHGVLAFERRDGQPFVVDVSVELGAPVTGDDLATTVHYGELAEQVVAIIEGEPVDLIETLAERIAEACLARPAVAAVAVTVHKPKAPIPVTFGDVAVRIFREATR